MKKQLAAVVLLGVAGCAAAPPHRDVAPLFDDAAFAPVERVPVDDVFALSPAMRTYVEQQVPRYTRHAGLRRGLVQALRSDIRLEYDAAATRTAAEAFEARKGNCLSLVVMTAALADALGVPVQFQRVYGYDTWTRTHGFTFRSGHVNLVLGERAEIGDRALGQNELVVDFLPSSEAARLTARRVDRTTVLAMVLNNRAAELTADGELRRAYWWARAALDADATFTAAYNTLAVIYLRHGAFASAHRVLDAALAREPENLELLGNLAQLYGREGRADEARALRARLAEVQPYPPFRFLDEGMVALRHGDDAAALRLFRREMRRMPYDDQVQFAVALASLRLGKVPEAREHLALALENATRDDRRELYAAKLAHLRQGSRGE